MHQLKILNFFAANGNGRRGQRVTTTANLETASTSTGSSSISTSALRSIIHRLENERHRSSTCSQYYCVWKLFNTFLIKLDHKPRNWEDRLTLFVGYLVETEKKSSTVKSYISAIKAILQGNRIEITADQFSLAALVRACRLKSNQLMTRMPIQKGLVKLILNKLDEIYALQPYLLVLYKAMIATVYYGLFKIGELMESPHEVKVSDVHIGVNKFKVMFMLRSSKTHSKGSKSQVIKISAVGMTNTKKNSICSGFCPFALISKFLAMRHSKKSLNEQFFIFRDRLPIKAHHFWASLNTAIKRIGLNQSLYGSHGLRSGRALDHLALS